MHLQDHFSWSQRCQEGKKACPYQVFHNILEDVVLIRDKVSSPRLYCLNFTKKTGFQILPVSFDDGGTAFKRSRVGRMSPRFPCFARALLYKAKVV